MKQNMQKFMEIDFLWSKPFFVQLTYQFLSSFQKIVFFYLFFLFPKNGHVGWLASACSSLSSSSFPFPSSFPSSLYQVGRRGGARDPPATHPGLGPMGPMGPIQMYGFFKILLYFHILLYILIYFYNFINIFYIFI